MEYSRADCLRWSRNKNIDPQSGGPLEIGSDSYNKLYDLCSKYGIVSTRLNQSNNMPQSSQYSQSSGHSNSYGSGPCYLQENYKTILVDGQIRRIKKMRRYPNVQKSKKNLHTLKTT